MTPADPATPALDPNAVAAPPAATVSDEVPFEDVIRAHNRFHDELVAGRIDPDRKLSNQHIAYYEGRVIDHDTDPTALYYRVRAMPGLEPALIVYHYLECLGGIPG
jgi:hypothetical protein